MSTATPLPTPARSRRHRRYALVLVGTLVVAAIAAVVGLTTGSFQASLGQVASALTGEGDGRTSVVVVGLRVPRVLAALAIGAALGVAGAVFQTLARNPLASPDIVGFSAGSATGALVGLTLLAPAASPAAGAWIGGLLTVVVVMAIARSVGVSRERTILAGIALSTLLSAVNDYLLTRAPLEIARNATQWLHGSLAATSLDDVALLLASIGILSLVLIVVYRDFRTLELGDDTAVALGVRTGRIRLVLIVVAALLTGPRPRSPVPSVSSPSPHRNSLDAPWAPAGSPWSAPRSRAPPCSSSPTSSPSAPWHRYRFRSACSPPSSGAPTCSGSCRGDAGEHKRPREAGRLDGEGL